MDVHPVFHGIGRRGERNRGLKKKPYLRPTEAHTICPSETFFMYLLLGGDYNEP
jgi:hypothetical protein